MVYLSCIASVKHKRKSTLRLVAALRLARLPLGPARDTEEGTTWGSWSSNFVQRVRPRTNEKCCAELVEFVIVVVFLMTLLCGIITYVLIQAAQSIGDAGGRRRGTGRLRRLEQSRRTAEAQAGSDVGWMNKESRGTSGTTFTCVASELHARRTTAIPASRWSSRRRLSGLTVSGRPRRPHRSRRTCN